MKKSDLNRRQLLVSSTAAALAATTQQAFAQSPEVYMDDGGLFGSPWDYAIGGHDTVAFFHLASGASPVDGVDDFVTQYKGVSWRFASQENLDLFVTNPDRYEPKYGGYCAWAMARSKFAKGDPKVWYVHDGSLYLNVNRGIQRKWLKNIDADIAAANAVWPGILAG